MVATKSFNLVPEVTILKNQRGVYQRILRDGSPVKVKCERERSVYFKADECNAFENLRYQP